MPSAQARRVLEHYRRCLGVERPPIARYHSDDGQLSIDVLEAPDTPQPGVVTAATLNLSDTPNLTFSGDVRVELLMATEGSNLRVGNVVATTAFDVMRGPRPGAWPGSVKPNALSRNGITGPLSDIMLVAPMVWEGLGSLDGVAFLQVIPISESETAYALQEGSDALEERFVEAQIDVFDWCRSPAL